MNVITMTEEQKAYKSSRLPVSLYPTKMREEEDGKVKYHARTMFRSKLNMEDIAKDLIATGVITDMTEEKIVSVWKKINAAVLDRILNGSVVDCGIGTMYATVHGSFDTKLSEFDPENNWIDVGFRSSKETKKYTESVTPVIGNGKEQIPELKSVFDVETAASDILTPGGQIVLRGKNLLVAGENEDIGLYFVNAETGEEATCVKSEKLAKNSSTELICTVPALAQGTYKLKVCTQKSKTKPTKETVAEVFTSVFSVN